MSTPNNHIDSIDVTLGQLRDALRKSQGDAYADLEFNLNDLAMVLTESWTPISDSKSIPKERLEVAMRSYMSNGPRILIFDPGQAEEHAAHHRAINQLIYDHILAL